MSKSQDISPPWGIANGATLGATVYFLTAGGLLYLSWRWALGQGWPPWPPARSAWGWAQWVGKSWAVAPDQMARGQQWLAPARAAAALAALVPLPLACLAGWWIARPGPPEIHLAGRQLSKNGRQALKESLEECKISGPGLYLHPQIQLSRDRETRHIFILGSIGGGKTVALRPLIEQAILETGTKSIIYDNKGEFTETLPRPPGAKSPLIFAPWDARCTAWDVSADVRTRPDARTLADRLIHTSEKDPIWGQAAQSLLVGIVVMLQKTRPEKWDFQDVVDHVFQGYDHLREIVLIHNPEGIYYVEEAKATKTTQGFLSNLAGSMSCIVDLAEGWKNKPRFSFRRWLLDPKSSEATAKSAKYLILQGNKRFKKLEEAYIKAIIAMISSVVNSPEMPDSKARRLWLFLDELPQLGKVPEIAQFLEIGRSKGVRVVMGVQDLAQLREIYSKDTIDAWASMVGTYLIARTQGETTPAWLTKLIKTKKVKKYRISYTKEPGGSGVSAGRQDHWEDVEEPVFRPEEFETDLGPRTRRIWWKPWKKNFYIDCLYHPGGSYVYLLPFRPSPKITYRSAVVLADWLNHPKPMPPETDAPQQGGEGGRPPEPQPQAAQAETTENENAVIRKSAIQEQEKKPQPQAAGAPMADLAEPQEEKEQAEETPEEIIVEEVAEEAAEALVDLSLAGAGAIVQAAELVALVQEATVVEKHKNERLVNERLVIKHETEADMADIWLEDELED